MDENDYLDTYSSSSSSQTDAMTNFPAGGFFFFCVTTLFVSIFLWTPMFKFCRERCSACGCPCGPEDDRDRDDDREASEEDRDRIMALELQQRLDEEAFESNRMAKRKERRMWYEYYLRPWTMTVKRSDLIREHQNDVDADVDSSTQSDTDNDETITVHTGSLDASLNRSDDESYDDLEDGGDLHPTCLRLPDSAGGRCVDGTCALCLDDYCAGDEVVWSNCHKCQHAFHKECFLLWLSKGKKRCPICRNWFVPGQKIEDQKVLHGEAWTDALAEMVRAEKEETERAEAAKAMLESQQKQEKQKAEQETSAVSTSIKSDSKKDSGKFQTFDSSRTFVTSEAGDSEHLDCDC
mmetsp:Transcript_10942/g.26296  ORF Transcript_10942/g.26296 Transcript_10942/m.26296 type:complete len:351 (-) Transcript_10942:437-1489(-)|eukprot:CAMPEP_0197173422 /NCGR_PEP_ID=MMETSP1423-20130617/363_1 /TAXON_ID=476441 /ORGANISM="Pseudo-nitzschia heimii, Strain UNC1101" /LENGTH=350 /DNA_ID=CAMNT_0042622241 /DNA_START=224 /DNA_END=1276 /DNA_ORIENTATION=-